MRYTVNGGPQYGAALPSQAPPATSSTTTASQATPSVAGAQANGSPPTKTHQHHGHPTATPSGPINDSVWKLAQNYTGQNFFSGWDFWNEADPTHGIVNFQDQQSAFSSGLASINDQGHAVMKVDTTPVVSGNRKSIRISTQATFTGGLVTIDVLHMPTGCGTWPAFWTTGPNWPNSGEIDIIENVHESTENLSTLHTKPGCTISPNFGASGVPSVSGAIGLNCAAAETGNTGCGLLNKNSASFGAPFNQNGGGVYAMSWDDSGISVFFFPRGSIPDDIDADSPQPQNWGTPTAHWPAATCNPAEFMNNHQIIFDTTLCGDWAGAAGVWGASGVAGQGSSCAATTGAATCEQWVQNNGGSFSEAYWEVKSVKLYQQ
ncbi:glycoside hydrolase family 16 protein [Botryobasidium botryosum FD-172 SS1]|uniref:Glycoside hydrolase family 16 protein n=1 Tax=Botryobasidium botryosum (strain FD-172 SS1) TaxID=930990 RepID=A0A067MSP7_BOTB1|nr:glycoside hydrolase family 16 protein [Botryobasidium botryosum FD-172 SS1]